MSPLDAAIEQLRRDINILGRDSAQNRDRLDELIAQRSKERAEEMATLLAFEQKGATTEQAAPSGEEGFRCRRCSRLCDPPGPGNWRHLCRGCEADEIIDQAEYYHDNR